MLYVYYSITIHTHLRHAGSNTLLPIHNSLLHIVFHSTINQCIKTMYIPWHFSNPKSPRCVQVSRSCASLTSRRRQRWRTGCISVRGCATCWWWILGVAPSTSRCSTYRAACSSHRPWQVCPHTYTQIHTHLHTHTQIHTYNNVQGGMFLTQAMAGTSTHTHTGTHTPTHTRTQIHTHAHRYTHTITYREICSSHRPWQVRPHIHTHRYTHTYTHTPTHTHTRTGRYVPHTGHGRYVLTHTQIHTYTDTHTPTHAHTHTHIQ